MTYDELVEAVAESAWQAESRRAGGRDRLIPWSEERPETQENWRNTARAIIPIVQEACAKVAEGYYPSRNHMLCAVGRAIAQAIRNMGAGS